MIFLLSLKDAVINKCSALFNIQRRHHHWFYSILFWASKKSFERKFVEKNGAHASPQGYWSSLPPHFCITFVCIVCRWVYNSYKFLERVRNQTLSLDWGLYVYQTCTSTQEYNDLKLNCDAGRHSRFASNSKKVAGAGGREVCDWS